MYFITRKITGKKVREWKNIYHANSNQKKAEGAMLSLYKAEEKIFFKLLPCKIRGEKKKEISTLNSRTLRQKTLKD